MSHIDGFISLKIRIPDNNTKLRPCLGRHEFSKIFINNFQNRFLCGAPTEIKFMTNIEFIIKLANMPIDYQWKWVLFVWPKIICDKTWLGSFRSFARRSPQTDQGSRQSCAGKGLSASCRISIGYPPPPSPCPPQVIVVYEVINPKQPF